MRAALAAPRSVRWPCVGAGRCWLPVRAAPLGQPTLPASLVADQVTYDRDARLLIATGNVEVLYQGRVLRAEPRSSTTRPPTRSAPRGRCVLTDPAGRRAARRRRRADPRPRADGLISSARLLIAGQMQLAAAEVRRTGGPLRHAPPHDRQLLHDLRREPDADLGDPRLARHPGRGGAPHLLRGRPARALRPAGRLSRRGSASPSPGVERASGFLAPSFLQSDIYGFGFKLPYYRVLGPSADATITPFVTTDRRPA